MLRRSEGWVAAASFAPFVDHPVTLGDAHHWNAAVVAVGQVLLINFSYQPTATPMLAAGAVGDPSPKFPQEG